MKNYHGHLNIWQMYIMLKGIKKKHTISGRKLFQQMEVLAMIKIISSIAFCPTTSNGES